MAPLVMREPLSNWEHMLEWWTAHSDGSHSPVREEDDHNFMESMQKEMEYGEPILMDAVDIVHQTSCLFNPNRRDLKNIHRSPVPWIRKSPEAEAMRMLDQLVKYSEYIYVAEALHEIKALRPLLHTVLLYKFADGVYNQHASVRAKTAEVVTAMVQNNLCSQELVLELDGLEPLVSNLTCDPDENSRTKALGAIFALIHDNKPGITKLFCILDKTRRLRNAFCSNSVEFQREAIKLIKYLLHGTSSNYYYMVTVLGFPSIMMHMTSSNDADVRKDSLCGLFELAESRYRGHLVKNGELKQVLLELIKKISTMALEDLPAAEEEILLVDSLWNACYNRPSSLVKKLLFDVTCSRSSFMMGLLMGQQIEPQQLELAGSPILRDPQDFIGSPTLPDHQELAGSCSQGDSQDQK